MIDECEESPNIPNVHERLAKKLDINLTSTHARNKVFHLDLLKAKANQMLSDGM